MEKTRVNKRIFNCRIVDTDKGNVVEGKSIIIKDEIIADIIDDHLFNEEESCEEIDIQGNYILPGFINTHTHLTIPMTGILQKPQHIKNANKFHNQQREKALHNCLEYGITTIRDALTDRLDDILNIKDKIHEGFLLGPTIITSAHVAPLGGTYAPKISVLQKLVMRLIGLTPLDYSSKSAGIVAVSPEADEEMLNRAINEVCHRNAGFVKLCHQEEKMLTYTRGAKNFSVAQLHKCVSACVGKNMQTNIHTISLEGFRNAVEANVASIAHLPLNGMLTHDDIDKISTSNIMIEPTLTVAYYYCWPLTKNSVQTEHMDFLANYRESTYGQIIEKYWLKELWDSLYYNFSQAQKGVFKQIGFMQLGKVYELMNKYVSNGIANMILLLKNNLGGRIAFGTDSGASHCSPATKEIEIELLKYCAQLAGMPEKECACFILNALTTNGAQLLGKANVLGKIREGYYADLVIYPKNPFHSIDIINQKAVGVFKNGEFLVNNAIF